jgi:hypothetical protein
MSTNIVIRVLTEFKFRDERASMLWVVLTDKPEHALRIVRSLVAPSCDVEMTDYRLSAETIQALGLAPGQAKHL